MALTVTNQLTTIIDCDDDTNWTGSDASIGLDTDIYKEATGSIAHDLDAETYYATYTWTSDQDFTDAAVYWWYLNMTAGNLDTWANGGIGLRLEDASGNWSEWWVGGKDNYTGGWRRFVVYTGSTPDDQSATAPTMTAIRKLHIRGKATAKSKLTDNVFIDYIQKGNNGIKVTGGGFGTEGDWDEVLSGDEGVYAGVIREEGGVYFINGPIQFGDPASGDIYFKDINQIIISEDKYRSFTTSFRTSAESLVASDHFSIDIVGNASGTTNFQLGSKSGGRGIQGCILKSAGNRKIILTASDTDIDELKLYGTSFLDLGQTSLPTTSATREVLSCNFNNSAEVLADTCKIQYCFFVNADNRALRISSTSHNVSDCDFINCIRAVHIDSVGTYNFDAMKFTGNTYDIENSSSGLVTINATNGSNPDPAKIDNSGSGATTEIINSVYLTVNVEDESGNDIQNARVSIETKDPQSMKGAIADDGGTQTDETTEANDATANDMTLLPAIPAVDDAYYFGSDEPFHKLRINIGTNGDGVWVITWEYYNGAWVTISDVVDGTNGFKAGTGNKEVSFSPPSDWTKTTIQSINAFWIRARVTTGDASPTSQPLGTQCWIFQQIMNELTDVTGQAQETYNYPGSPVDITVKIRSSSGATKYIPAKTTGQIDANGYTLSWVLIEDIIAQ